jgi:hypothetical protein
MKAVNPQNQVQAGNLDANGGVLGALVGAYARKKDYETRYAYRTSLMEYDNELETRRGLNNTVNKIVADQIGQATSNMYTTTQEAARARNKMGEIEATGAQKVTQIKTQGSQDRRTEGYRQRTGLETTKKMTAGLETSAGLPLSGGISPMVAGPNAYQGQIQAFKSDDGYHPHMGMPGKSKEKPAEAKPTTFAGASGDSVPASDIKIPEDNVEPKPDKIAAKGGKGKKTKPFADPSVEKNVKPVPDKIASPFSAPDTRSAIFADASSSKTPSTPAAKKA